MDRGRHLFSQLFDEERAAAKKNKGRNADLVADRNEQLLYRYFYLGYYTEKRNEAILQQLKAEYYLTERHIFNIISDNFSFLQELRKEPPRITELSKKYPHIVWPPASV